MILKVTLLFEKEKAGQRINYNTQTGENHTNFESRKCIFHFNCIDTRCNTRMPVKISCSLYASTFSPFT